MAIWENVLGLNSPSGFRNFTSEACAIPESSSAQSIPERIATPVFISTPVVRFYSVLSPRSSSLLSSRPVLGHQRHHVLLELQAVLVELANAFGELLGRHRVLVVHPEEILLGERDLLARAALCSLGRQRARHF